MKGGAMPAAEIVQRDYLDGAGLGVKVFTRGNWRVATENE
jgi:hypothetical protein